MALAFAAVVCAQMGSAVAAAPVTGAVRVTTGERHSCVLANGRVWCWGANDSGQLGNGTIFPSAAAVGVVGLGDGVTGIAAGRSHTCAAVSGGAKCWGANPYGQLGNGTKVASSVPVPVIGLESGVAAVTAGYDHSCALTTTGGIKCWGMNETGQLGTGTYAPALVPADVVGLASGTSMVTAGAWHSCAAMSGGGAKCWGRGFRGQLGHDSQADSLVPVDVAGLADGIKSISAGSEHTCAVTDAGQAKCWGRQHRR